VAPTALTVCLAVWYVALRSTPDSSHLLHQQIPVVARNLASGLFLVAGVLRLARWRFTGEPQSARTAIALLLLGTAVPAAALIGPLLHESVAVAQNSPSARALFLVPVFALLLPSSRWPRQTVARPIPAAFAARTAAATAVLLALLLAARALLPAGEQHRVVLAIAAASVLAWLLVVLRTARDLDRKMRGWSAAAAALLGLAELLRAWAAGGTPGAVGLAPVVELTGVAVIVCVATVDLRDAFRGDTANAFHLSRALTHLERHLAEVERAQRERLHDARSAVVGVMGASQLLATPTAPVDADLLRRLLLEELKRLQAVLDPSRAEPVGPFELTAVLAPVIAIHQLDGSPIDVQLGALWVLGRPTATATVLDNLLRNARVHAPGAHVTVRAIYRGEVVSVVVEDDGPGIPEHEREAVLQAGVRGTNARGSGDGLGLHSCAVALHAQGGSLQLAARHGGGTRVLFTVPTAVGPSGALAS
jgi:signal transduction histidine kinase